jgi:hypothetical protein
MSSFVTNMGQKLMNTDVCSMTLNFSIGNNIYFHNLCKLLVAL